MYNYDEFIVSFFFCKTRESVRIKTTAELLVLPTSTGIPKCGFNGI